MVAVVLSVLMAGARSGSGVGNSGWAIKARDKVGGTALLIQMGENGSNAGSLGACCRNVVGGVVMVLESWVDYCSNGAWVGN